MRIRLTQGKVATIDDEDVSQLCRYRWYAFNHRGKFYAARKTPRPENKIRFMHQDVSLIIFGEIRTLDHINRNSLDNRRSNLRVATVRQNTCNQSLRTDNTSGYKGVSRKGNRWEAKIKYFGHGIYIGLYDTPEDAAIAYNEKAIELHGEFSWLNSIPST